MMQQNIVGILQLAYFRDGDLVTYQELAKTIQTLSISERLSLLEMLTQSLQADFKEGEQAGSSILNLRGILKNDGPTLSDDEIRESYTNYLIEKYS